ncbi:hypothetical protein JYU02_00375 [bacterium AH-315-P15]|nr:hypothetical protein [bacterium AH-315-P15]
MAKYAYTVNWDEPEEEDVKGGFVWTLIFVAAFAGLAVFTYTMLAEGFATDSAARIQGLVDLTRSEENFLAENFARIYPVLPFLMGLLFANAPQIADAAPYYVDCFAAALLLGVGFQRLVKAGVNPILAGVMIALLGVNPLFLFVASSGSGVALALVFAYMFAIGTISLAESASVRGLILISFAYAGLLLTTPLGFYFLVVSVPFLFFMSRQRFISEAPASFFIVVGFVPAAVLGSLLFMNWVFIGDVAGLLRGLTGGVATARAEMGLEPWPFLMGGNPLGVAGVMAAGFFLAFPVLALALTGFFAGVTMLRATLVMAAITMITGAVTTYLGVLSHPAYLWVFAAPVSLVALEELRDGIAGRILAIVALAVGIVGGWWLLGLHPTLSLNVWRAEIGGRVAQVTTIEIETPEVVVLPDRREAALVWARAEARPVWGAREDILRAAEGNR